MKSRSVALAVGGLACLVAARCAVGLEEPEGAAAPRDPPAARFRDGELEISAEALIDRIRGGLLGQLLGNLNGLQHEMRYIDEPGAVSEYVPALPDGARTDDDTDFEWVYVLEMQRRGRVLLRADEIRTLWRERINRRIWCSNQYARQLMDLGLEPPLTGSFALNPWADFNISGQFLCETFGLIAPAMPRTAARIGLNYTRVAIDLEPAQTTQFFTAMIATAFRTVSVEEILEAGLAAIDESSRLHEIVADVRRWHREQPSDWRETRARVKEKYSRHGGAMRDRNGFELNTASTIAALLYGAGDPVKTLTTAFNFGWDCDNSAATAGTIVGVIRGYRWMLSRGWKIVDRYENTTRDRMPTDETITSFADRLVELAEATILDHGGERRREGVRITYRIPVESPRCVYALDDPVAQRESLRTRLRADIRRDIITSTEGVARARAAYLAICLDLAPTISRAHPEAWSAARRELQARSRVIQALFHHSPVPAAEALRARATAAGVAPPGERRPLW